ncbi:MAG: 5-formyltetrahydrofolate cyclo-ligase, partial [Jatrophihabitantaceae bacterium]
MTNAESAADKQDLRAEVLQVRRALTPDAIEAARAAVRAAVLARRDALGWTTVAAYLPLRTEPGSHELLDELVRRGVRVLVPAVLPDRDLDWVAVPGDVPLGVEAVAAADAVLV